VLKKLALTLFALAFSLGFAEVAIRLVGAAPKIYPIQKGRFQLSNNPKLGYEPVPLVVPQAPAPEQGGNPLAFYDYLGASNRLGFRDREHEVAKPEGTYRIAVLGDSVAAGLHVARFEDTFPPILERILDDRLRAQGQRAEVMSFAVSGYNTQQEVEIFRAKGLEFRPDLVLLTYTLSSREHVDGDILKTLLDAEKAKGGVSAAAAHPLLSKSALYRFLRYRVMASKKPIERDPQRLLDQVAKDTVAQYFGELATLAREHDFEVLVAVVPRFTKNFRAYPLGDQHAYAEGLAKQHKFAYLDLISPLQACRESAPTDPIELDNFHPSATGHRCIAEALAGVIKP
jgi:lysophospholipase L1-like esterase